MSIVADAKRGIVTEEMKIVAAQEGVTEDFVRRSVAGGHIVIPVSPYRKVKICGIGEGLRRRNKNVRLVAVEPAESAVLSGGPPGGHKIDGVGAGFVVPLWEKGAAEQIEQVSTDESIDMAFRLAREEGLFAGASTGSNVIAALRTADQLGPHATVVTILCDTGMKYLKTYATRLTR